MAGNKKIIASLALATSLLVSSSGMAGAATLENAGFESYTNGTGIADSWVGYQPSTATGNYQIVSSPVQEGLQAQRFDFSKMNLLEHSQIDQLFDIEPGAEYEISGYFNIQNLYRTKIQLGIEYFDAGGNLVDSNITNQSLRTNGYVRLQTIKVANLQAVKCRISIALLATGDGASGTFTVDQLALHKANELLVNPGFEDYHGMYDVADTWRLGFSPKATMNQKVVTSPVASGQYAQKISAAGLPYWGYAHVVQVVTAREGQTYTVSGKFNIEELNTAKVQLYVDYYDANYKHLGSDYTDRTSTTNGYVQLQNKTTAPKNAAFLQVWTLLRSLGDNGSGTFYIDDVRVTSVPSSKNSNIANTLPSTPEGVRNSVKGDGTVTLAWSPAKGVASYKIYQDDRLVKTVSGNATGTTLKGLTNNKVYHYSVSAVNDAGESLKSQAVRAMPYWITHAVQPFITIDWGGTSSTSKLNFDFQKPTQVREYTVDVGYDPSSLPKKWTFEAFDGTDWIVLDEQNDLTGIPAFSRLYFTLDNEQQYLKYRLNSVVSSEELPYLHVQEFQLIGK